MSAGNQNFRPPFTLALPFTDHYYLWLVSPDEISLVSCVSLLFKCCKRILCMQVKALKMTAAQTAVSSWHKVPLFVYSYFEKGVRKSHATIPKGGWFWVRCSSRKFERMAWEAMDLHVCLPMLKGKQQNWVGLTVSVSGTVHWLYPILPFGIVPCKFFVTTFLEIVSINGISRALTCFKFNSISISSRSNCWI